MGITEPLSQHLYVFFQSYSQMIRTETQQGGHMFSLLSWRYSKGFCTPPKAQQLCFNFWSWPQQLKSYFTLVQHKYIVEKTPKHTVCEVFFCFVLLLLIWLKIMSEMLRLSAGIDPHPSCKHLWSILSHGTHRYSISIGESSGIKTLIWKDQCSSIQPNLR